MQPCYLDRAPSISSATMTSTKVDRSQLQLKVTHKAPAAGFATCSQEKCSQTVLRNFHLPVRIHVLCDFSSELLRFFSTMRPKFFRILTALAGGDCSSSVDCLPLHHPWLPFYDVTVIHSPCICCCVLQFS